MGSFIGDQLWGLLEVTICGDGFRSWWFLAQHA